MEFLDKYLYLFDYWNADLLKPFEDDFFTHARERLGSHTKYKITKFIEFVQENGKVISFPFVLEKDFNGKLSIGFGFTTFFDGLHLSGYNEIHLYHHKEKLKEVIYHIQKRIIEIKKVLHKNESQKLRYAVGMDLFDNYPNSLEEDLQSVLKTTEKEYEMLKKKRMGSR